MPFGPCNGCGKTNYPTSVGGPYMCPSCDCGLPPGAEKIAERLFAPPYADSFGYALAMRVMQSDLYPKLAVEERAECDELIRRGQRPSSGTASASTGEQR
jgi:hypothetical protein